MLIGASGSGKSTFAADALQADRGHLVGLLPRPGRRRPERPGRDGRRLRGAAVHREHAPRAAAPDGDRRDQRAARVARAAPRARPPPRPDGGRDRARHARGASAASATARAPDRDFGAHVLRQHRSQLRRSLKGLQREGFRRVWVLRSPEEAEAVEIGRVPLWTDRRAEPGPFDIVGDVHGCRDELAALLRELGYDVQGDVVTPPDGRRAVFVGDYGDRGPDTPGVLRLVMGMARRGHRDLPARQPRRQARAQAQGPRRADHARAGGDARAARGRAGRVHRCCAGLPRRARQPRRARRRPARRRARRPEGGLPGSRVGARARLRAVRRDDRRDRRVRPAGAAGVGGRVPRPGVRRLRPHAGARARVGEQHDQHRHGLRVRRAPDGAALARARARLGARAAHVLRAGEAVPRRRRTPRSRSTPRVRRRCSTSRTSRASA